MKRYINVYLITIPLSILLFVLFLFPLMDMKNNIKNSEDNSQMDKVVENMVDYDEHLYNDIYLKLLKKYHYNSDTINYNDAVNKELENRKKEVKKIHKKKIEKDYGLTDLVNEVLDSNYLILTIYFLLILALNAQFSMFLLTVFKRDIIFDEVFSDIADWAINSAPILGVMGTIVSFAILVSLGGDIQESFSKYFFDAAITTILGGMIYVLNLFWKIQIFTHIKFSR